MLPEARVATLASFAQRSMWAAAQRARGAPLNNLLLRWRLQGELRRDVLEAALADLLCRHPILQARLELEGGQLVQVLRPPAAVPIQFFEERGESIEVRKEAAVRRLREVGRASPGLAAGAAPQVFLLRLSPAEHLLYLVVNHAFCDGWSSQILIRDLAEFYKARAEGRAAELPQLTEQYADFALSQLRTLESGGYAEEVEYWRTELEGVPPPILLPTLRPRRGTRDWECDFPDQLVPTQDYFTIREMARRRRVSVFSILLAALSVMLRGRTGASDMLVGVSTLNRWSVSSHSFVGCATNLLPARIRLNDEMCFSDVCAQVHATVRRLVTFGRVPLELILRETKSSFLDGLALPVWCQFREAPPTAETAGLVIVPLPIERASLQCELELDLLGTAAGLRCEFAYRRALFEPAMVAGLMIDFIALLRAGIQLPESRVAELVELCK